MKSILLCAAAAAALTTFGQAAAAAPKPRFPIRREALQPAPQPVAPAPQAETEPVVETPPVTAPAGEVASSSLPPLAPPPEPVQTAPAEPAPPRASEARPVLTLAWAVTVAPESAPASAPVYTMQSGDTLTGVSRRFKTTVTRLRALNDLSVEASIKAGQKIRLPGDAVDTGSEPFAKGPAPVLTPMPRRAEAPARAVVPRPTPPPPAPRTLAVTPRVSPPAAAATPPRVVAEAEVPAPPAAAESAPVRSQVVAEAPLSRPAVAEAAPPPAPVRRVETPAPAPEPARPLARVTPPPAPLGRPLASVAPPVTAPPPMAAVTATASIPTSPALTPAEAGRGRFVWPVRGEVISSFGPKGPGQSKDGLNIAAREGDPVLAAASGEVVYAGDQVAPFGKLVLIKHDGGWVTAYAHLSEISVKMKDRVSQSGVIGKAGRTGAVPTPQLYFEVRYAPSAKDKARPVDPMPLLPQ